VDFKGPPKEACFPIFGERYKRSSSRDSKELEEADWEV
jgi:hypothetical protein